MPHPRQVFQTISYLQYPFIVAGLGQIAHTLIRHLPTVRALGETPEARMALLVDLLAPGLNIALMLFGIALSLSTLQDPTKTQNEFSRKVWSHPVKGKWALGIMSFYAIGLILVGLMGLFRPADSLWGVFAGGLMSLGIAYVGVVRVGIDMFEHHRTDR